MRVRFFGRPGRLEARFAGMMIACQAFVIVFGALAAYGLNADRGVAWWLLGAGGGLALLCFVCAGAMRTPWGVTLGWLLQLATLAWALIVPAMLVLAAIFLLLWWLALVKGRALDERPVPA